MNKIPSIIVIAMVVFMFTLTSAHSFGDNEIEQGNHGQAAIGSTGIQANNAKGAIVNTGTMYNGTNAGGEINAEGGDASIYKSGNSTVNVGNSLFGDTFSPKATIEEGAVKNTNTNFNTNFNTNKNENENTNVNVNKNIGNTKNVGNVTKSGNSKQKQQQQQANKQVLIINEAENKRDHLSAPANLKSNAKLTKNKAMTIKTYGWEILDKVKEFTWAEAKKLGKDADDFDIEEALLFENSFTSANIFNLQDREPVGKFMGYLYLIPDGDEVSAAGGVGRIATAAMKAGASHFKVVKIDTEATFADGSAWNLGLSGGASIMRSGDEVAIAPSGGLGIGGATAYNDIRPAAVVEVYFDESALVDKRASVDSRDNHYASNNVY